MTRQEYLDAIRGSLVGMPSAELRDILSDFEEHFDVGLSQGKTEHEVSAELGDPVIVARTYMDPALVNVGHTSEENEELPSAAETAAAIKAGQDDLVGPRVFVVLLNLLVAWWVAIALYAINLAFWFATAALFVGGILTLVTLITGVQLVSAVLLAGIGLILVGVAFCIASYFLTKWTIIGTKAYVAWNKNVFNQGF
jgi:uncharacterized membrane protein